MNIIPKSEINSFPIYSNKTQSEIEEITTNVDINEFIRKTDNQILFLNNFVKYNNLWEYHYKIMDENKSTFQIKKLKINSSIPKYNNFFLLNFLF